MKKYFCDECGKELTTREVMFSLELTGKELCSIHTHKITKRKYKWTNKGYQFADDIPFDYQNDQDKG
jgi:hypothetical protein